MAPSPPPVAVARTIPPPLPPREDIAADECKTTTHVLGAARSSERVATVATGFDSLGGLAAWEAGDGLLAFRALDVMGAPRLPAKSARIEGHEPRHVAPIDDGFVVIGSRYRDGVWSWSAVVTDRHGAVRGGRVELDLTHGIVVGVQPAGTREVVLLAGRAFGASTPVPAKWVVLEVGPNAEIRAETKKLAYDGVALAGGGLEPLRAGARPAWFGNAGGGGRGPLVVDGTSEVVDRADLPSRGIELPAERISWIIGITGGETAFDRTAGGKPFGKTIRAPLGVMSGRFPIWTGKVWVFGLTRPTETTNDATVFVADCRPTTSR